MEEVEIGGISGGSAWAKTHGIQVCDEDGDALFMLPPTWSAEQINVALRIYRQALTRGQELGERVAQERIRSALGINHE